jgi:hypothetical protein
MDPMALIEIAKIAVRQNGPGTSEFIRCYHITDQTALIEIAKIAAAQDSEAILEDISDLIGYYAIEDQSALMEIFLIVFVRDPKKAVSRLANYRLSDFYPDFIQAVIEFGETPFDFSKCAQLLQEFADKQKLPIQQLISQITGLKDSEAQKTCLCWLIHLLGFCLNLTLEQSSLLLGTNFPKKALDCRDPHLRYILTEAMLAYARNPAAYPFVIEKENKNSRIELVLLLCVLLKAQGISEDLCQQLIAVGSDRSLKDKTCLRIYLNGLRSIWENTNLDASDKTFLLKTLLTLSQETITRSVKGKEKTIQKTNAALLLQQLQTVSSILFLNGEDRLKELSKDNSLEEAGVSDQKDAFSQILLRLFQTRVPIKPFENFNTLYAKCFAEARIPNYIITYAARLQSLGLQEKEPVLASLSTCIENMLDGTFSQERYSDHVHLQKVFLGREQLLEQWKQGEISDLTDFLTSSLSEEQLIDYDKWTLVDTDNPEDLFLCATEAGGSCQRINGDSDRNKCLLGYVMDGKNRLLAVKDASGRIIARHILRVLWDGSQPVLFLTRLYASAVKEEVRDALEKFALSRAKKLDLPLLSVEVKNSGLIYPKSIMSLGSKAPFEYLDGDGRGGDDGVTSGTYRIEDCYHLNPTVVVDSCW